jgi:hypothetical protein
VNVPVAGLDRDDVDLIVTLHLAYSPSLYRRVFLGSAMRRLVVLRFFHFQRISP